MKAIITEHLVRKTRTGKSSVIVKIESKKEEIVNVVNDFIAERAGRQNFIPVEKFEVKVYDYKNRVVNQWEYKPTYRA